MNDGANTATNDAARGSMLASALTKWFLEQILTVDRTDPGNPALADIYEANAVALMYARDADMALDAAKRVYEFEFANRERRERQAAALLGVVGVAGTLSSGFVLPTLLRDHATFGAPAWCLASSWLIGMAYLFRGVVGAMRSFERHRYHVAGPEDVVLASNSKLKYAQALLRYTIANYTVFNQHVGQLDSATRAMRNGIVVLAIFTGPATFITSRLVDAFSNTPTANLSGRRQPSVPGGSASGVYGAGGVDAQTAQDASRVTPVGSPSRGLASTRSSSLRDASD